MRDSVRLSTKTIKTLKQLEQLVEESGKKVFVPVFQSDTNYYRLDLSEIASEDSHRIKYYELSNSTTTAFTDIKAIVDNGYVPIVRYGEYDYLPIDGDPSGRLCFVSMYDYNVVTFMQILSDNTWNVTTRPFMIRLNSDTTDSAEDIINLINVTSNYVVLKDPDGTEYHETFHSNNTSTKIETWEYKNSEGIGYRLIRDYNLSPNSYSKTSITADVMWCHFENTSHWMIYNTYSETTINETMSRTEGELIANQWPINLPAGIYQYSIELAVQYFTLISPDRYEGCQQLNFRIKYGSSALRSMALMFDGTKSIAQTKWMSGIFKMTNPGDLSFTIALADGESGESHIKVSHVFLTKIG